MPIKRFESDVSASEIRALTAAMPTKAVAEILRQVSQDGDDALLAIEHRVGDSTLSALRVPADVIAAAPAALDADLLEALRLAIENVREVAIARRSETQVIALEQGQSVTYRPVAMRRAAAYVPGGRGSYPSTAIMCLTTAHAAGVHEICVFSPVREDGEVDAAVLAVCSILGIDEVYRVGGAHAVAAAAFGTETIDPVDIVVGPGNAFVQEAKRQLVGTIAIDSIAGPSELVVVADDTADPDLIALDLKAQGEHGDESLVALITTDDELLEAVGDACADIGAELALIRVSDLQRAIELADAIAPEHLQLMVADAIVDELAEGVRNAGALFVGSLAATAFGDYVIGSNHVLPTGGSARFSEGLSVDTFTRKLAEIRVPESAAVRLADAGATLARAEGFNWHAKSMEARKRD